MSAGRIVAVYASGDEQLSLAIDRQTHDVETAVASSEPLRDAALRATWTEVALTLRRF